MELNSTDINARVTFRETLFSAVHEHFLARGKHLQEHGHLRPRSLIEQTTPSKLASLHTHLILPFSNLGKQFTLILVDEGRVPT